MLGKRIRTAFWIGIGVACGFSPFAHAQKKTYLLNGTLKSKRQKIQFELRMVLNEGEFGDAYELYFKSPNRGKWERAESVSGLRFMKVSYVRDISAADQTNPHEVTLLPHLGSDYFTLNERLNVSFTRQEDSALLELSAADLFQSIEGASAGVWTSDLPRGGGAASSEATRKDPSKNQKQSADEYRFEAEGRFFEVSCSDGEVSIRDPKTGESVLFGFLNCSVFNGLSKKIVIDDGILSIAQIPRKIDLRYFNREVRRGDSEPPIVVRDEDNKEVSSVAFVDEKFPDLVALARERLKRDPNERGVSRSKSLSEVGRILGSGLNVRLLGAPGSGKTTLIAKEFALKIALGEIKDLPRTTQLRAISATRMDAGSKWVGTSESRVEHIENFSRLTRSVWWGDEFPNFAGVGTHSKKDQGFLQQIKGSLETGAVQFIAGATQAEWNRQFMGDPAFKERFEPVIHRSPENEELVSVLKQAVKDRGFVAPPDEVIWDAIALSERYSISGAQPRKAARLLIQSSSLANRIEGEEVTRTHPATLESTRQALVSAGKVDAAYFTSEGPKRKILKLMQVLESRLIGHEAAKQTLMLEALRSTAQVGRENELLGLLYFGPPGTGKTMITELEAEALGYQYKRISLADYTTVEDVERLRYAIFEALSESPTTLINLDEIEKAHPKVLTSLLPILGEQRFTVNYQASNGRWVYEEVQCPMARFRLTSNAGADVLRVKRQALGFTNAPEQGSEFLHWTEIDPQKIAADLMQYLPEALLSRLQLVGMPSPMRSEYERKIRRQIEEILDHESEKHRVNFKLENADEMVVSLMKGFVEGKTDYREAKRQVSATLELLIAHALLFPETAAASAEEKTTVDASVASVPLKFVEGIARKVYSDLRASCSEQLRPPSP